MLSERQFSGAFSDWWRWMAPRLGSRLMRSLAATECPYRVRWEKPFQPSAPSADNHLVAELAFGLFYESHVQGVCVPSLSKAAVARVGDQALQRLSALSGNSAGSMSLASAEHFSDAIALALRLEAYVVERGSNIIVQPKLRGLGLLHPCNADLLVCDELIEVKMGTTWFRSKDLRQLLVYLALARADPSFQIGACALVNPRTGLALQFSTEGLIRAISDMTASEFFSEFHTFISDQRASIRDIQEEHYED